jgi:hypothetical protein
MLISIASAEASMPRALASSKAAVLQKSLPLVNAIQHMSGMMNSCRAAVVSFSACAK